MAIAARKDRFFINFQLILSIICVTYFEYCAIIPYILRSLRIKKMFLAREEYIRTQKIPRDGIKKWNETRVLAILVELIRRRVFNFVLD
jgi:hypothetical protein